jgi:hypothetical protein
LTLTLVVLAGALAACGSSSKNHTTTAKAVAATAAPTTLAVTISESGASAKYSVPSQAAGGLVNVALTNNGKNPHAAQLILIGGNHTPIEALRILGSQGKKKVPGWLRAEGGVGGVAPGQTGTATVNLPAGNYVVVDVGGGGGNGPPAFTQFTVTPGTAGSIPAAPVTVTAANPSKDHYKWQVSGALHAGANDITFVSKGRSTLHELTAFRITGHPTRSQIIKALNSNGPQLPAFIDGSSFVGTAVIDSGLSLASRLQLTKPGTYVLFCHITDRDGGKPHFQEGLLTTVAVQ